jgi:hypothetical protein
LSVLNRCTVSLLTLLLTGSVVAPALAEVSSADTGARDSRPDRITDVAVDAPDGEQVGSREWIVWDPAPTLLARPTDDDFHQWVKVRFKITGADGPVWRGWSYLQPEGTYQRLTVPAETMIDGMTYQLRARTRDITGLESLRWSKPTTLVVELSSSATDVRQEDGVR